MLNTGWIGSTWRANYSIASRVPFHPSLGALDTPFDPTSPALPSNLTYSALAFVHAGIAPTLSTITPFPTRLNALGASLLDKLQSRSPLPVLVSKY